MVEKKDSVRHAAASLLSFRASVLSSWKRLVLADPDVSTAGELTDRQLEDHVPELIAQICRALTEFAIWRDDADERGEAAGRAPSARKHVEIRARQGYDLVEVLRELHLLRQAIIDICEEQLVHLGGDAGRVVHSALDAAMILAVANRLALQRLEAASG